MDNLASFNVGEKVSVNYNISAYKHDCIQIPHHVDYPYVAYAKGKELTEVLNRYYDIRISYNMLGGPYYMLLYQIKKKYINNVNVKAIYKDMVFMKTHIQYIKQYENIKNRIFKYII